MAIEIVDDYPSKMVDLSISYVKVYQRVKPPFSYGFPMIFHKSTIFHII